MASYSKPLGWLAVAFLSILSLNYVCRANSVLTGRWGDTRLPQQLVYNSPSKKTTALVVVTFSTQCPLARRVVPLLNELQAQYAADGISLIGLFPNGMDNLREMAEYAVDSELTFPVFKDDPEAPWHVQLGLKTTPQVVVLDTRDGFDQSRVFYRGQINGRWFGGGTSNQQQEYLADALASLLRDELPPIAETAASGCNIASRAHYDLATYRGVTYHQEISRLIQNRCLDCHREGEPGAELFAPFDSYETVAAMSAVMFSRIENRLMPPWHGTTDPNNGLGGFKHDARLTEEEINLFRAWVEADCPAGDSNDAPPPKTFVAADTWKIGTPDFVFEMPEPYQVPKYRLDEYQYYRIRANFPEDRYIQAIEMKPGNKAVVHHIGAIVGPASDEKLAASEAMLILYGLTGDKVLKIGDYIAGDPFNARTYPNGYALKLPAGHDLFFEIHYTPTGREELPDQSRMAIRWAEGPPKHVIHTKVFNRKDLRLRPHDMHYEKKTYYQFTTDVLIHALAPHMHYRGKDFTLVKVENPGSDQERRTLVLKIAMYDFNWQRTYEFVHPLKLKAGDALYSVTHFDNSHFNPNNPNPEASVRFGLKSEQEMLNLRIKYETADFGDLD
jgi:thiol-disulfide isomerase/thioredoxin